MEIDILKDKVQILLSEIDKINKAFKLEEKINELNQKEKLTYEPNFYNSNNSSDILQQIKNLSISIKKYVDVGDMLQEVKTYIELYETEKDEECLKEAINITKKIEQLKSKLEVETLLSEEYDNSNAIVTIHPGAGGTESADWALMLYRMYTKWANKNDYQIDVLDIQNLDEAGIKSVSFLVKGLNTYGYLKGEKGVHRLVRISPFDSNSRRHTSFAAVEVLPDIDDSIVINIDSEDLQIDTFRASGAGGQHVNKTESAIRIRHIPTGIVVGCQTERSQLQNKENAMKMLKSKLYIYEKTKNEEKITGIKGETLDIAWGSQIRSYIFCPYTLVKDHRTNYEIGNIQAVMDGKIDEFMYEYLKYIKTNNK